MNANSSSLPLEFAGVSNPEQTNLYAPATYTVAILGASAAALVAPINPVLGIFVCALVCGWAEIDGLCGSSHVGAFTPLRLIDKSGRLWVRACLAYTLGGVASASLVGLILGLMGAAARTLGLVPELGFGAVAVMALILALRELGLPYFVLPEFHRQTDKFWALRFGFVTGAAMWGSHIGLGFATVIRHGGLFVIGGIALLLEPLESALLLATFWFGRTLPIWATPRLTHDLRDGDAVTDLMMTQSSAYRICAFAGLAVSCALASLLALS